MMDQFNRTPAAPLKLQLALPSHYEAIVEKRTNRPVVKGERFLTSAEKAGVVAEWLGAPSHRKDIERAWKPVLFNQAHDLASGVMVDKVYDDTMLSYGFARRP